MPDRSAPTIRLILTDDVSAMSEGRDVPYPARLKRLLKFALRACGFRCDSVEIEKDSPPVSVPQEIHAND